MERLTKVMSCPNGTKIYDISNKLFGLNISRADKTRMILEKLAEYEDLEKQGGIIKLPCKMGDTVYCIENKEIYTCIVEKTSISKNNGVWVEISFPKEMPDIVAIEYNSNDIGKTVFLTKSAAEEKLKELRGGEDEYRK